MQDEEKKRIYELETTGVPPLKMVLVHAENERQNRTRRVLPLKRAHSQDEQQKQEVLIRLIETLEKE